jgi:hypothetical protein
LVLLVGCAGRSAQVETASSSTQPALRSLQGARFVWVEAECSDGPLELGQLGFERELAVEVGRDTLLLTFDTAVVTAGCRSTSVVSVKAAPDADTTQGGPTELYRYTPESVVTLPAGTSCGAVETSPALGTLRLAGDQLELVTQGSPWCRGFDARFVYRRSEPKPLLPEQVAARYVAHFDRGDARSVAALFEAAGSLVEPFTRTDDGNYERHEGRAAVQAWLVRSFASTPWHAMRLLALVPGSSSDQLIADWEYMDANLAEPLRGRNLFVIAAGEIYESEIQLTSDPKPAAATVPAVTAAQ